MNKENKVQKARQHVKELKSLYPSLSEEIIDAALDDFADGYESGYTDGAAAKWISIKDQLPEVGTPVLLHTEFIRDGNPAFEIFTGFMDENGECLKYPDEDSYGWQFDECVTHWQPLPLPPKPPTP